MKKLLVTFSVVAGIMVCNAISYAATNLTADFDEVSTNIQALLEQTSTPLPIIGMIDDESVVQHSSAPAVDLTSLFNDTQSAIEDLKLQLAQKEEEEILPVVEEEIIPDEVHAVAEVPVVDFDDTLAKITALASLLSEETHAAAPEENLSLDELEFGDVNVPSISSTDQARQLLILLNEKYDALKAEVDALKQMQTTDARFTDTQNVFLTFLASLRSKEPDMYTKLLLDMTELFKQYQVEYME